ncbi:1,3-beta-galactosyl-N-acetylhexosamine phosphorylase [Microaceticoccus formicicus]|uniref:1,3-beta-galactosyl-N-acetylhexosamine phosphorylase n=1 Tax=Microaceticoccus formicicus TaxID=3118105 RepID=UPI003CD0205D|nr:1,3-beta-galactosyl-N-acetylhexosamine phosphorylase [Peptoniphilaceae bacterium AMB_02]
MDIKNKGGRLTLPGEENFLKETIELMERWKADAIRDADGTELPEEVKDLDATIYTKYFVARGHNDFARENLNECQHFYLMSDRITATEDTLIIDFMSGYFDKQIKPDYDNDPKTWWEVIDRTTGEVVPVKDWEYDTENHTVKLNKAVPYHVYTLNFLAYAIWDPTQMYNYITNDWKGVERDIPFDIRYKKSWEYAKTALTKWLKENPKTDVVRFTTFFYHFTLVFNQLGLEKFVEWFGYTGSVSPEAILEFEKEYGYRLSPEDFVDEGYYNSIFRVPTKKFLDFMEFQQKFVTDRAKVLVDLVHEAGKKAIMFLGDNWIGTEPYGEYFKNIGLDGVAGSVGDGVTLRVISDIEGLEFTEGRFLPYFFPDTFYEGNDPCIEAVDNWTKARRALVRKPLDRIGYGGYPSLAYKFPKFIDYIEKVADEFREIHEKVENGKSYKSAKVAVLNAWGKIRTWMPYVVAHGKRYKLSYSYQGITEALSGMDVDVEFIDFNDIRNGIDESIDVIINAGDAYTAFSGGSEFLDPVVQENLRQFVYDGGGFIGVGEPSAYSKNGTFFQMSDVLGVDKEIGFSQSTNKYFMSEVESHFITKGIDEFDFGEGKDNIYALDEKTEILSYTNDQVNIAARDYGKGRSFYITGLPYSLKNTRLLKRAIHYVAHKEDELNVFYAEDYRVEVLGFTDRPEFAAINNSDELVQTKVYGKNKSFEITLQPSEMKWILED